MDKQQLKKTVLYAPKSLKTARYIADTLALQINIEFHKKFPNKDMTKYFDRPEGFSLCIPMQVDGKARWCAIFKYTKIKGQPGPTLEFDPRIVSQKSEF